MLNTYLLCYDQASGLASRCTMERPNTEATVFCREKKDLLQGGRARRQEAMLRYVYPVDQLLSSMFITEVGNKRQGGGWAGKWSVESNLYVSGVLCPDSTVLHASSWVACANSGGFPMLPGVDCHCQPVMSKVHYQSSPLVVLVPQCAWRGCQQVVCISVVSLVFCKTSLVSSMYHFISILFLPYGPWVCKVRVWLQCQVRGWTWIQPPSLPLPSWSSRRALGLCSWWVPGASWVCLTVLRVQFSRPPLCCGGA